MNRPTFNVLSEPWIPVIYLDGSKAELGILDCLRAASRIKEIRDASPIIEFGLYRLLTAFVLDALILDEERPEDPMDLTDMLDEGGFEDALLTAYAEKCGDVFDLFHPQRPFLQVPLEEAKPKAVAGIFPVSPSGTVAAFWLHRHEEEISLSPPEAARALATVAPFMTAGGAGLSPSINGSPSVYLLPMGATLYETLILNLPLRKQENGTGLVAWRSDRRPGETRTEATTPEAMTWRPRAIQLIPEELDSQEVRVRQMKFEKGDKAALPWVDSSLAYRVEAEGRTPIRMREGQPLWRDAGPLLLLRQEQVGTGESKAVYARPDVVEHAVKAFEGDSELRVKAYGMRTDMKMKVFEWAEAVFHVPPKLARSSRLGAVVHSELDQAAMAAKWLRGAIRSLYPRDGKGRPSAFESLAARAERAFWNDLEKEFQPLMNRFAELPEDAPDNPELVKAARKPWREALEKTTKGQFEEIAKDLDSDSDALERMVRARSGLYANLRKHLS